MNLRKDRMVTGHWWEVPWGERGEGSRQPQTHPNQQPSPRPSQFLPLASFTKGRSRSFKRDQRVHVLLWGASAATLWVTLCQALRGPWLFVSPPSLTPAIWARCTDSLTKEVVLLTGEDTAEFSA